MFDDLNVNGDVDNGYEDGIFCIHFMSVNGIGFRLVDAFMPSSCRVSSGTTCPCNGSSPFNIMCPFAKLN